MYLPRLDADPAAPFPPATSARQHPNGLMACGGDLCPTRLMNAYRQGIFPWYSAGEPILWWSPDPRAVFDTQALHLSRRLRRQLRQCSWTLHADSDFSAVVAACATAPRNGPQGTWILPEMQAAYERLHQLGFAHSFEVYDGTRLVGGVYGVLAGPVFCGESMFGHASGASKLALAALCRLLAQHGVRWLDAQMRTEHLDSLGVRQMTREAYLRKLTAPSPHDLPQTSWETVMPRWVAADFACSTPAPAAAPPGDG